MGRAVPLTSEQEQAEHELRMDQMAVNIEKMRHDIRWEVRKFIISTVLAAAALVGAGVAIGNWTARPAASAQSLAR